MDCSQFRVLLHDDPRGGLVFCLGAEETLRNRTNEHAHIGERGQGPVSVGQVYYSFFCNHVAKTVRSGVISGMLISTIIDKIHGCFMSSLSSCSSCQVQLSSFEIAVSALHMCKSGDFRFDHQM